MVFQSYALYPEADGVREHRLAAARAPRLGGRDRDARAAVAALLHIERLLERKPAQISGGEMQRVALAPGARPLAARVPDGRAAHEPRPQAARRDAHRAHAHPPLARAGRSSTSPTTRWRPCRWPTGWRCCGRERCSRSGRPRDVYERPANRWVAGFVGSPRISLLPCRAEGGRLVGESGWSLPRPRWAPGKDGRRLLLGLRAEDLSLERVTSPRRSRASCTRWSRSGTDRRRRAGRRRRVKVKAAPTVPASRASRRAWPSTSTAHTVRRRDGVDATRVADPLYSPCPCRPSRLSRPTCAVLDPRA